MKSEIYRFLFCTLAPLPNVPKAEPKTYLIDERNISNFVLYIDIQEHPVGTDERTISGFVLYTQQQEN